MSVIDRISKGLRQPSAYPHPVDQVQHIETHISHILLAGDFAYKLKKPLNLGFLDFSSREKRLFYCSEELRLNRRLAPDIYLDVVPITGTAERPLIGGKGEALEHAVKMRRFDQDALLTRIPVTPGLADLIAEHVAEFHARIPSAAADSKYGTPQTVLAPMLENFEHIRAPLPEPPTQLRLGELERWTRERRDALWRILEQRRRDGSIRECHGDMHRGNIALLDGRLVIFDGIEFNPALRWIDTMSELAFLVMDLEESGQVEQARRLLNRYLEISGDYAGLCVLDFYKVYRAMVRAKVTAIRLGQNDLEPEEAARDREDFEGYLTLAEGYTRDRPQRLIITHGLSGSGKSSLSVLLREHLPLIHIRSDLERKRLFGLPAQARTGSGIRAGIYSREATERTYAHLLHLAGLVLDGGYSPLVDAAFLRASQRSAFIELANRKACPITILELRAPTELLRQRLAVRERKGTDASEAGVSVLESQLASAEPLTQDERRRAIRVEAEQPLRLDDLKRLISPEASQ